VNVLLAKFKKKKKKGKKKKERKGNALMV